MNRGNDLRARIKQEARNLGIDLIGFSRARTLAEVRSYLERRAAEGRTTGLECLDIELRVDPERILPGARTIITAGISYWQEEPQGDGLARGSLSRSAWGKDYHRILGNKLERLAGFTRDESGAAVKWFVDTGPPVDRALAVEAGLGWSGKNCALINPEFGSWVFLGQIYTELELEPDSGLAPDCGECDLCLKACPTGALREAHIIDPYRCISYLTQMKGFVPLQYRPLMETKIYGCDTCQAVCPANQAPRPGAPEFAPELETVRPRLQELLHLSNREFKARFGESAAGWRGRTVLQRNALIALGNLKMPGAVADISVCLRDDRAVIRGHAAWALGEIGDRSALRQLEEALRREQDPKAARELAGAISKLKAEAPDPG
ncbi:MAG: tRNA epoxyqueuosine(34) reductase QueG [Firmicutes bacterium]|nr:tRNA epoxyqueuosine(34) reductase QueG [Bacillota bacterium]